MNYNDFLQRLEAVQSLMGGINIPADLKHVTLLAQIHGVLNQMKDECNSCIKQQAMVHASQDAE